MSGIINSQPPAPAAAPGATGGLNNPLLQQAEAKLEAGLSPENRGNYDKIVVAGLHIALDKGAGGFMAKLANAPDPIGTCAKGAVALILIMRKQARGVMPMKAAIPAGMTLMFHGLDFIDRAKVAKIGPPELDAATRTFTNELFHKLNITPGMLQQASTRVHAITQDPQSMAAISLKAGLTRHPDAAVPTPVPGGPPGGLMNGAGGAQ